MIVITGTKRSGTSMWMQVLRAARVRTIGAAFAEVWKETIEGANKRGFFESRYRRGIYYATNPHPETGVWLHPKETRLVGVKVFIPGVIRSDVAYLSRVVASVRPFRQYAASLNRLYEMERKGHEVRGTRALLSPHLDPVLEWWLENFLLVRDLTTRRYPARLVSYESMIESPEKICQEIFSWIGLGDAEAAAAAVHPEDRTQTSEDVLPGSHPCEEIFDEYHHRIKQGRTFDRKFLEAMNDTHAKLLPEVEDGLDRLAEATKERRARIEGWKKERQARGQEVPRWVTRKERSLDPDRLDNLLHPRLAVRQPKPDGHAEASDDEFDDVVEEDE